jgi:hypothetical protein
LQDRDAVEKVGQYLLSVRAVHIFLMTLLYTYTDDNRRVQSELNEFHRYPYTNTLKTKIL